jgi:hypothetical protein
LGSAVSEERLTSVLLVVSLPLQLAGFFGGPFFNLVWLPMFVFEVTIAFWLLIKGVAKRAVEQRAVRQANLAN